LSLIDFELAGLLHLIAQIRQKESEHFSLLFLDESLPDLVFFRGEILIRRSLAFRATREPPRYFRCLSGR
jgi:hypothetical protein